jgi:tol-pal system protein YbgF
MDKRYMQIGASALAAALMAGCASTPKPAPEAGAAGAAAPGEQGAPAQTIQALGDMEALRLELAELRNQVEIQRNEMEKLQRRQRELYDDLDYRLRERERGATAPTAGYQAPGAAQAVPPAYPGSAGYGAQPGLGQRPAAPAYGQTATAPQPGMQPGMAPQPGQPGTVPDYAGPQTGVGQAAPAGVMPGDAGAAMQPPAAGGGQVMATAPTPPSAQMATVASAEEQAAYDGAFELLKQSRYGEAVEAFRGVVLQFPNGALADDAQYWVGEAMYVTRDFPGALDAFRTVVERFPASPRVPEALLKVGYVQYEMGNLPQAQMTLSEVIARFPGSRVAISAQTRLRKIEQGG